MGYPRQRYEIFRFEHDQLLYRVFFMEDGEIAFTVSGDSIRLGLLAPEDFRWNWDWNLPTVQETSRLVNVHSHSTTVMRRLARQLAQYLAKHRPAFFYYQVSDDARRHRTYLQLAKRHGDVAALYEPLITDDGRYVMWSLAQSAAQLAA